ncbi:MAG TPA: error-prone DNA polymerase [Phycisphaerales bacterium]|mgnify:CR=1 FL=1|nr:error-prone DNA polymerase [Phycisphaerales bacterium]HMP37463.1 error-prone DNA polymerase [Phycisphaerales bacterium]
MPEDPIPKPRMHPWQRRAIVAQPPPTPIPDSEPTDAAASGPAPGGASGGASGGAFGPLRYAELEVRSNFTFLAGASHPDELVERAARLGHAVACIADVNSLAGVVRGHLSAKQVGIPFAVGCRIELRAPSERAFLAYPLGRAAYARLCRLLTIGKRRAPKGDCHLELHDLLGHLEGMHLVALPPRRRDRGGDAETIAILRELRRRCGDRISLGVRRLHEPGDEARLEEAIHLGEAMGIPLVACNDVHCHVAARQRLQDVLVCIRCGCTLGEAGRRLFANSERRLKSAAEMAALLPGIPEAIARAAAIAEESAQGFSLDELRYEYPDEVVPEGRTPMEHLRSLVLEGAARRWPEGTPERVRSLLAHELALIEELGYAKYFLTVEDICRFARGRAILHQGRGAAANSAVCYCLGVTAVDPARIDMLFERFVSRERDEPPDIDIDFEHERREEVIQYIYRRYGRDRAALVAEVISYRARSALRDVGKALGLSLDLVDRLAKDHDWWSSSGAAIDGGDGIDAERARALGLDPGDPTLRLLGSLCGEILGFPRHLSQHVGGFVISRGPLAELVPVENAAMPERTVIEWDKDDVDAMGMLKVDVLGLGMLSCLRKAMALVDEWAEEGAPGAAPAGSPSTRVSLCLATIPAEDPAVYEMLCRADTVGVFQIESRAQMSMLPRLRPRCFYDLVIEVAIVRPGPIQGQMVHPYLRRRDGLEPVVFPDEAVRRVLGKTLGVPLFQEQAMSLAVAAAGFTPGEADQLRRAIGAWKSRGNQLAVFGERIVEGMIARGYGRDFAEQVFTQIKGFSGYGFPESHAASFALLVYASAWLKRHHPAAFAAALINSQPMGFYAPAQLVRDAIEHGVRVLPVDVGHSGWDCTLEAPAQRVEEPGAPPAEREREPGAGRATERIAGRAAGRSAPALRLGMRLVAGLRRDDAERIVEAVRRRGPLRSIAGLVAAMGEGAVPRMALRRLAAADAFRSMGLDRQRALWAIAALVDEDLPLFRMGAAAAASAEESAQEEAAALPLPTRLATVARDCAVVGLTLREHPMSFARRALRERGVVEAAMLRDEARMPQGREVSVAGLVLVRQRPATAKGIVFMTIEDESAVANIIVRPDVWRRDRRAAKHGVALLVHGHVERQGQVVHVVARRVESIEIGSAVAGRAREFR